MSTTLNTEEKFPIDLSRNPASQIRIASSVRYYHAGESLDQPTEVNSNLKILLSGRVRIVSALGRDSADGTVYSDPGTILAGAFGVRELYYPSYLAETDCVVVNVGVDAILGMARRSGVLARAVEGELTRLTEYAEKADCELRRRQRSHEERTNLEQLLTLFVSSLTALDWAQFDQTMQQVMSLLSTYFQVDQIALYRFNDASGLLEKRLGWSRLPKVEDCLAFPRTVRTTRLGWLWERMLEQEPVVCRSLAELPEEAREFCGAMAKNGIASLMYIPIHRQPRNGYLALHGFSANPDWSSDSTTLLHTIGEVITSALVRRDAHLALHQLAFYDPLTRLGNSALLSEKLNQAQDRAEVTHAPYGLLFVNIDRFKRINESLGRCGGDKLLAEVAGRLDRARGEGNSIVRLGGDEFIIIASQLRSAAEAPALANAVCRCLDEPFVIDGHEIYVTLSVGIALYPDSSLDPDNLVQIANFAMHEAKRAGGNTHRTYLASDGNGPELLLLESKLKHAIERDELVLYCQPKIDTRDGCFAGAEALVRWENRLNGLISPNTFLPLAEESGLIVPLSEWVLREACRQRLAWPEQQGRPTRISVNVSARWLGHASFVNFVLQTIDEAGMPPQWLELEVTEQAMLSNMSAAIECLDRLRATGITIALDDFGTGYSSLAYLRRLPVDSLKIDRSFVMNIGDDAIDAAIVDGIVKLAHTMRLEVVAEGIEDQLQFEMLKRFGCDVSQGFLTGRPMGTKEFTEWLAARPQLLESCITVN